jgi:acetyltransferase
MGSVDSVGVNPTGRPAANPTKSNSAAWRRGQPLDAAFHPRSVAVIGATEREGSVGRTVVANLNAAPFGGNIYPVNPGHTSVLGIPAYPSIGKIKEQVELAIVITPAATVPGVIGECVDAGVRTAVVISAGFRELGAEGAALEKQIAEHLKRGNMRLIGPNCLGIMNPILGLNATFAQTIAKPGNVAFLSQSGALLTAILDWSLHESVGFSAFVSTGSMLDVGWGDLIDYFGYDADTQSILIYMESVGDARAFLSAAREVAMKKPIIIIKAGRTEAASKAASSHTGAMTGSDEVFDAALRRCGVLRVQTISDVFYMAEVLSRQPRPRGPKLTILTNAGGPAVLATDALIANGGELAALSDESRQALDAAMPPHWSRANPIDILGDAEPERYAKALEIAINDPASDGLLVILAPQGMTDPAAVAKRLSPFAKGYGKPLLASWMGAQMVGPGERILNEAGIPTFNYPDTAARAFDYMWRYSLNLHTLYETPMVADDPGAARQRQQRAQDLLGAILAKGRTLLTEAESKQILALYGIPTVPTMVAATPDEAAARAAELGFPVVLKLHSETVTHKTDVGGVKLSISNEADVRRAFDEIRVSVTAKAGAGSFQGVTVQPMIERNGYELILGSTVDSQFGPVILFGSGGQLVEVYGDRALGLPPLNTTLAQRLIEQTRIYKALKGVRGRPPVDVAALESLLVRFSYLTVELARVKEIDINPLLAAPDKLLALDARIVLHDASIPDTALPRPAIRPYPSKYVWQWKAKDGAEVRIRPIRPEDEPLMVKFHESLSEQSVYLRYFHMENLSSRVAHERLLRKCFIDYDREMALVAERADAAPGQNEILAVGRLTRERDAANAELAVLVTDKSQHGGLGTELVRCLVEVAKQERYTRIVAHILPENIAMRALAKRFGFAVEPTSDPSLVTAALTF